MRLSNGTHIGPYEIVAPLGAGGMGEVYRAKDTRLDREVAIKVLPDAVALSPQILERFQREARAASALNHPHICTIYDVGADPPFIAMELLEGETLQQRIARAPVDAAAFVAIALAVADALEAAHAKGIVHRDIKPANIVLTARGPKILDFGLAKTTAVTPAGVPDEATRSAEALLTDPGRTVGTVSYMSPEQVRAAPLDARTDIFSFGVVLYEMATGSRPFRGESAGVIFDAILNRAPAPAAGLSPDLPAECARIIDKCLEKDRELRYRHAADIRADLQRLKRGGGPSTTARTPASSRAARRWTAWAAAAAAVAALAAAGAFYLRRAPQLTDKDTIVLADFANTTGDPVFDETLRQGLSIQLEQSPFLRLLSEERIRKTLALMGQPADARLTPRTAQDVCVRTAGAAVLEGSIASLGTQYVVGLRARNCRTGDVLDEEQTQAAKKEDVLDALTRIARTFRTRVGESLATVRQHDTPLDEATTSSLDALKAYSAASKILQSATNLTAAVPLYKRAIEIDPKFAMAHAALGLTYGFIGEPALSSASAARAYELRERASDPERFFITATYDLQVTGNLERARQTCEAWAQSYPRDIIPNGLLGSAVYPVLGQFEKGIEAARQQVEVEPDFPIGYYQLSFNAGFLHRLDLSGQAIQQATAHKLSIPEFVIQRYDLAFLKGDAAGMAREAALARGTPAEQTMSAREAFVAAYAGRLDRARQLSRHAQDLAEQANQRSTVALVTAAAALREAFLGSAAAAREIGTATLAGSTDRDPEYGAALALALTGESTRAQASANDLERRFPEDTSVRLAYVPAIRAQLALNRGEPAKAIDLLRVSVPLDLGVPSSEAPPGFFGSLYPTYVRGQAYLAARRWPEAAAAFQTILDHPGIIVSDPVGARARLQLARTLALAGDAAKAKRAYEDFLALWKDADAGAPLLAQAQAEYARLR